MDEYYQFSNPAEAQRREIIRLNEHRSLPVITEHEGQGATSLATFISQQLPPLDPSKRPYTADVKLQINVVNADTFLAARELMDVIGSDSQGSTAVLNLASDQYPGGGYKQLCTAQEEALCYTSTLFYTLAPLINHYPWPNKGPNSIKGIFSPGVVVFRKPLHDYSSAELCPELAPSERKVVSVITVAAPRFPELNSTFSDFKNQSDKDDLREKVRLILRMAAWNGQRYLVLGAMGCGAYRCPPLSVASEMKSVMEEPEFAGWFLRIVFAVYSTQAYGQDNFSIFKQVFEGV